MQKQDQKTTARKGWTPPRLQRLGTIADISAGSGINVQGQPNRS